MLTLAKKSIKNEKGMAIIEMIPMIIIILVLTVATFGFFGAIHTAIISSITARNYAFETMRHKADLTYFRSNKAIYFSNNGYRAHQRVDSNRATASEVISSVPRRIDFMMPTEEVGSSTAFHNNEIKKIQHGKRYTESDGVNPIWVRTQYGICVNSKCGE